ncbi:MAG: ABC transporter ATP-binding protein [Thaumarchaeota archaeon]|nr:ABC transporter ATP-binding protein [Nitrososphaerota archaeon]
MSPSADNRKAIVEAKDVVKIYTGEGVATTALDGLSMKVYQGEFVAIVGPSGSGKSTLLNMLGALDIPTSGKLFIDGIDITTLSGAKLAELRNRKIGFIFQSFNLISRMNALQNVELPLAIRGVPSDERRKRAIKMLELVGLRQRMLHKPFEMSGGEQQRVAIARALVTDPAILLGDEPSGNLDTKNTKAIVDLIKKLNKETGKTIIVITHNLEVANEADRIIFLRDGRVEGEKLAMPPMA